MSNSHIQWSCPELPVYLRKGIIGADHAADFQIFRCQCWSSLSYSNSPPKKMFNPDHSSDLVTVQPQLHWHNQGGCDVWGGCKGNGEARHAISPPMPTFHGIQTSVLISWFGNNDSFITKRKQLDAKSQPAWPYLLWSGKTTILLYTQGLPIPRYWPSRSLFHVCCLNMPACHGNQSILKVQSILKLLRKCSLFSFTCCHAFRKGRI